MPVGEVFFIILLNCIIIFILYRIQQKSFEKRIKHLGQEIQDLEDLVAAIMEEFEEIAEVTESRVKKIQQAIPVNTPSEEAKPDILVTETANRDENIVEKVKDNKDNRYSEEPTNTLFQEANSADESEIRSESQPAFKNPRPVDSRHQRILDLWEQGTSVEEIAKKLGTGRGEVQLILGIYKRS